MHNRSQLIVPTIHSVLGQSMRNIELIVVDDGSDDDSVAVVRALARSDRRIRLIATEKHGHPSEPRNIGVANARSDIIAYIDHDDVWTSDHLAELYMLLRQGADIAFTGCIRKDESTGDSTVSTPFGSTWHARLQVMNPIFEPSRAAHDRALLDTVGGWLAGPGLEDWDLWLHFADHGARFASSITPSAVISLRPTTRRYRTMRIHRLRLGSFDSAHSAARAAQSLKSQDMRKSLFRAARRDGGMLLSRLAAEGELVTPRGWDGHVSELSDDNGPLATHILDLVVVQRNDKVEIQLPLWCRTVDHAWRIWRGIQTDYPAQRALIAQTVSCNGGLAVGGIDAGTTVCQGEPDYV